MTDEYAGKPLAPAEVHAWAHKLASYWYPSYNTDLAGSGPRWPDDQTEPEVRGALGDFTVAAPTVVMCGKPEGRRSTTSSSSRGWPPSRAAPPSAAALQLSPGPGQRRSRRGWRRRSAAS